MSGPDQNTSCWIFITFGQFSKNILDIDKISNPLLALLGKIRQNNYAIFVCLLVIRFHGLLLVQNCELGLGMVSNTILGILGNLQHLTKIDTMWTPYLLHNFLKKQKSHSAVIFKHIMFANMRISTFGLLFFWKLRVLWFLIFIWDFENLKFWYLASL